MRRCRASGERSGCTPSIGSVGCVSSVALRADALTKGFHVAFGVGALLLAAGIVVMALTVRRADVARIHTEDVPEAA